MQNIFGIVSEKIDGLAKYQTTLDKFCGYKTYAYTVTPISLSDRWNCSNEIAKIGQMTTYVIPLSYMAICSNKIAKINTADNGQNSKYFKNWLEKYRVNGHIIRNNGPLRTKLSQRDSFFVHACNAVASKLFFYVRYIWLHECVYHFWLGLMYILTLLWWFSRLDQMHHLSNGIFWGGGFR